MGLNPFTRASMLLRQTRDPGPDEAPRVPLNLRFQCVLLPPLEDWEDRYLALDLTLSKEPGLTTADREADRQLEVMFERGLCDEPLYGGMNQDGAPLFFWSVPARITHGLAAMTPRALPEVLREWNTRSQYANDAEDLNELRELARAAASQEREMFIWQVHPTFRCS